MSAQTPLTGGDGIPRERGMDFKDKIFFLSPRNSLYVEGLTIFPSSDLPYRRFGFVSISCLLISIIVLLYYREQVPKNQWSDFSVQFSSGMFGLWIAIGFIPEVIKFYRLVKGGILLVGQVKDAVGTFYYDRRYGYHHKVTIKYCVKLPDGRVIEGIARGPFIYSPYLENQPYRTGAPVAVLYKSDTLKLLL